MTYFQVLKRGYEDRLIVDDTSYDHQGEYVCEAVNMIGGVRKAVQSEPIQLEVRGNCFGTSFNDVTFRCNISIR